MSFAVEEEIYIILGKKNCFMNHSLYNKLVKCILLAVLPQTLFGQVVARPFGTSQHAFGVQKEIAKEILYNEYSLAGFFSLMPDITVCRQFFFGEIVCNLKRAHSLDDVLHLDCEEGSQHSVSSKVTQNILINAILCLFGS